MPAQGAEVFRDARASGGRCVGVLLTEAMQEVLAAKSDLAAGDYEAEFTLEAVPVEILHHLAVQVAAGNTTRTFNQIHFDGSQGYQPFRIRFSHPGGVVILRVAAKGGSGFDGMRKDLSEQELGGIAAQPETPEELTESVAPGPAEANPQEDEDEALELLEAERGVGTLSPLDHRLLCDRVRITCLRLAPAMVRSVEVDKIHYRPRETVKATVRVGPGNGPARLVAEEVTEIDAAREVHAADLTLGDKEQTIEFTYPLDDREFGHELRASLVMDGKPAHSASALFGVSANVYRVGITVPGGGQDMRNFSVEQAAAVARAAKASYGNYFERFAWAPCDYSNLAPETEIFFSGQTQYPGSISGFKNLISEAHKVGVKAITYGKSCGAGIEGWKTFQRHPEYFQHHPEGVGAEAMSVFYLERMLANDYNLHAPPSEGGWQHWASLWVNWSRPESVEFGAEAIVRSVEMFGWDGVRWDGHFVGKHKPFIEILDRKCPGFVHGYNIAFANPGGDVFLPPAGDGYEDFHEVAANHGMLMDESVRDWSHSNFSPGFVRPFYEAICREADYEKRIGGLPLFITFDMASAQDRTWNCLYGLAAGQRYTYLTSPADFPYGSLAKFLTRYSAFVWDDTARLAKPEEAVRVSVTGDRKDTPWWDQSVWLRQLGGGRQQLLVNLLNPPGYTQFSSRVQKPATAWKDVAVAVRLPAGATFVRAAHVSPDLAEGHALLDGQAADGEVVVVVPRLHLWSVVVFEWEGGPAPAYALTRPVEQAAEIFARRAEEEARKSAEQKAKAGIGPSPTPAPALPYYQDYANTVNADAETAQKMSRPEPLTVTRNGVLDVHHMHGPFNWLNPIEGAAALAGHAACETSWVDLVGFKLGAGGCMDGFPDTYERLFGFDVLVLDNVHAFHLGAQRRVMIADFVRNGGGLLVFGGCFTLSQGADHNTGLAEALPVRIAKFRDVVADNRGLPLKPAAAGAFPGVDWSVPACAYSVDVSPLKDGATVLATAGDHPAIVSYTCGKGRVIAVLINPHGVPADGTRPYWEWSQWPRVLAACLGWVGAGFEAETGGMVKKVAVDPAKMTPERLFMEGFDLPGKQFTAMLREAMGNVVDAESARMLLEAAVDNVDKVEDTELLSEVAELASPYLGRDDAELGEKLTRSNLDFIRGAGYRCLGLAGDPKYRAVLEKGLAEDNPVVAREALLSLGRLGQRESAPAVEKILASPENRLLAAAVLLRIGRTDMLSDALAVYEQGLVRRIRLKSGKGAAIDNLYGGVSFKLTPAQRKRGLAELRKVERLERNAIDDIRVFNEAVLALPPADAGRTLDLLSQSTTREILPLAYALYNRLPAEAAQAVKPKLLAAQLTELRLLAE